MTPARTMFLVAAIAETILAIPLLGGTVVITLLYIPLLITLALHITALVMSSKESLSKAAPIVGIATSLLAWIPGLGWAMHLTTAILYFLSLFGPLQPQKKEDANNSIEDTVKDAEIVEDVPPVVPSEE